MKTVKYNAASGELEPTMELNTFACPHPDSGADIIGVFSSNTVLDGTHMLKGTHVLEDSHLMVGQEKSTVTVDKKGNINLLEGTEKIASNLVKATPPLETLVREAKRQNPATKRLFIWYTVVTNCRTAPTTAGTLGKHAIAAMNAAASGGEATHTTCASTTIIDGVTVYEPAWLLCGRDAVMDHLPPQVKAWAKEHNHQAWMPDKASA